MFKEYKRALNVKQMKEALVNYSGESEEFFRIWKTFYHMQCMGFITHDEWKRFYEECHGWHVTEDQSEVRDGDNDDKLIWRYTSDAMYTA